MSAGLHVTVSCPPRHAQLHINVGYIAVDFVARLEVKDLPFSRNDHNRNAFYFPNQSGTNSIIFQALQCKLQP